MDNGSTITIAELREHKEALEEKVRAALNKFSETTGIEVVALNIKKLDTSTWTEYSYAYTAVKAEPLNSSSHYRY